MECLCIYIVEIKFLSLMSQWKKNNLLKQFICLVEIPFYAIFPKTWVLQVSKTTLENGQMGYIGWSITNYFEAKIGNKLFRILVPRE